MSGSNNIPIAPTPSASSSSTSTTTNELNGKRKLAPRPSDEFLKQQQQTLVKIQPKDSASPSNSNGNNNINNGIRLAPAPSQASSSGGGGIIPPGSILFRPVSTPNQKMIPPSLYSQLQRQLQDNKNLNGMNIIQDHQQRIAFNQTLQLQQHQQQHQHRLPPPIAIAPRPSSLSATPSTSDAGPSSSSLSSTIPFFASTTAPSSSTAPSTKQPPKICPRPIEKKPNPSVSAASGSTAASSMNITPQNVIPTPGMNAATAVITGYSANGTPTIQYLQNPGALGLHPQLRFSIPPQGYARMQMPNNINPMSIFPQGIPHHQVFHPAYFSGAGGNTFISQGIPQNALLSISGNYANQIPANFLNQTQFLSSQGSHLLQQHQQHQQQQLQQQQQPRLIPITTIPTSSTATSSSMAPSMNHPIPIAPNPMLAEKMPKLMEAGSDDDENEPPPLLDRDETVPANLQEAFVQEATAVRMQFSPLGIEGAEPLRHVIDGFIIEESAVPFDIDDVIKEPLEVLRQLAKQNKVIKEEMETSKEDNKKGIKLSIKTEPKKRGRKSNNEIAAAVASASNGAPSSAPVANRKHQQRRSSPSSSKSQKIKEKQQRRSSSAKLIKSPPPERPSSSQKSSRTSREIKQLLHMDFGPKTQTTSVEEYTKEIQRRQKTSTSLRPVVAQHDYREKKETTPERSIQSLSGEEQECLNCKYTFAELQKRYSKYPQYCTKECRREFRAKRETRKAAAIAQKSGMEVSSPSSSSYTINDMASALLGDSRKRLSNESEASSSSRRKLSPTKLKLCSSTDSEFFIASPSQIFSPGPSTSSTALPIMPSTSSTPLTLTLNLSNGSNPGISSPPPSTPAPTNPNTPDFAFITAQAGLNPSDVYRWSTDDVSRWVNSITNSEINGEIFKKEEIDGTSLLMVARDNLQELKIKLGPALKIEKAIAWLIPLNQ